MEQVHPWKQKTGRKKERRKILFRKERPHLAPLPNDPPTLNGSASLRLKGGKKRKEKFKVVLYGQSPPPPLVVISASPVGRRKKREKSLPRFAPCCASS